MVAETPVNPTEILDRVKEALTNFFTGQITVEGEPDDYGSAKLVGEGKEALERFRIIIQRDRIRAAARAQLIKGSDSGRIIVYLNKQVAFAGHVSFSAPEGESPLGPIRLSIETQDPLGLIEWLTGSRDKPGWREKQQRR